MATTHKSWAGSVMHMIMHDVHHVAVDTHL